MGFDSFVEGPLAWIAFLILIVAVASRLLFFFIRIIKSSQGKDSRLGYDLTTLARLLLPFHKGFTKRPVYAVLRYVFHLCMFVVPVWLGGHITLWSESRFGWDWVPLPDAWADWMTLTVTALGLYFIIRRILSREVRISSSVGDFVIILIAGLPFYSGYFLTHGTLDKVAFLGDNMRTIHVLAGEAWLVMATFLFCRTRLNPDKCTGCASCVIACPTATLEASDHGNMRIFKYSHYQCVCCASCVKTCPENAAELRHEVSLRKYFQIVHKEEIRAAELKPCRRCGELFVPEPLFQKIGRSFKDDYLHFCPNCRKLNALDLARRLSPWHKAPKDPSNKAD